MGRLFTSYSTMTQSEKDSCLNLLTERSVILKQCTKCGELKPLSEFCKRKTSPDGHQYHCKECHRLDQRRSRERYPNKEREYYNANREKHISRTRVCRAIVLGRLKRASEYKCAVDSCRDQAAQWHHMNYEPDPILAPLCARCHAGVHYGSINSDAIRYIVALSGADITTEEININYLKYGETWSQPVSR